MIGPSLVARRVTSARCAFDAALEYRPRTFQHLAGITAYYNTRNWYYLHVTADDQGQAVLRAAACDRDSAALARRPWSRSGGELPGLLGCREDAPLIVYGR
jgi:xylan 1,4-beta-xylosidase